MKIIEIQALPNGAHRNQTTTSNAIPDGWAEIPEDVSIPATFPFVTLTVEGQTVTGMESGVVPEPEPELTETEPTAEDRIAALESANAVTFVTLCELGSIDTVTAAEHTDLFSPWAYPVAYKAGSIREHGGKLYKCLTAHTSQESWTPDAAPSLWVAISDPAEEWAEWSQPIASTDAYGKGAQVSHNGKHWISDLDANVWEPGVYGWTETA